MESLFRVPHSFVANDGNEPRVDFLAGAIHRVRRSATALSQGEQHPTSIFGVYRSLEVTPNDQGVDQLTGPLLRETNVGNHVAQRGAFWLNEPEDVSAVRGHVVKPRLRQRVTDPKWFGRAFAVSMNLNSAGTPLAAAVVGAIAARSVVAAFFFGAGLTLFAGIWPIVFPFKIEKSMTLIDASEVATVVARR